MVILPSALQGADDRPDKTHDPMDPLVPSVHGVDRPAEGQEDPNGLDGWVPALGGQLLCAPRRACDCSLLVST